MQQDVTTYDTSKKKLEEYLREVPLNLRQLDRQTLEAEAATRRVFPNGHPTLEHRCVNYLRHRASDCDGIIRTLNTSMEGIDPHVLYVERRGAVAAVKKRILDAIAELYPWLKAECLRQKARDGIEDEAGDFILPFGPFKGRMLREVDSDYLLRLLGQSFVRRSFRTRIERHLAERQVRGY